MLKVPNKNLIKTVKKKFGHVVTYLICRGNEINRILTSEKVIIFHIVGYFQNIS